MPSSPFTVAAIQMSSGPDEVANLQQASGFIDEAVAAGARLVVLPEVFGWRGPRADEDRHRQLIPGPTIDALAALARRHGIHLCAGSILETIPGDPRAYNTSCLLGPDGAILGLYRKIHLFDIDLPGQVTVRESDGRRPGEDVVVVATPLGTLGLSICYDLRFPELYRALSRAGAEILVVPSAFTFPTGAAHWETLCRARAIENQSWVIAANQTGTSPHGFADYGQSMIVDPWGAVVARAGDGPGVVLARIDPAYTARVRRELPALQHRRLP